MQTNQHQNEQYIKAKNKVRQIKLFYIHFAGYIILVLLLLYNLYILDENNEYADFFTWFNSIIILAWTIFIIMHWWPIFKGKIWFKRSWEDKKIDEFLEKDDKEETTIWE